MGFLDNLLKKGAKNIINNLVDEATDRISDVIDDAVGGNSNEVKKEICSLNNSSLVMKKLEKIFSSEYSQYEVRKDVNPNTIGGEGTFRPYTYGLYLNGQPMAFIMVTDHNKEQLRAFRWSKKEAEKNGIPFINFLTQFPNTEEYIKNRLAQYIK